MVSHSLSSHAHKTILLFGRLVVANNQGNIPAIFWPASSFQKNVLFSKDRKKGTKRNNVRKETYSM